MKTNPILLRCCHCKQYKVDTEFYTNNHRKFNKDIICKSCKREYYLNNREAYIRRAKESRKRRTAEVYNEYPEVSNHYYELEEINETRI